MSKLEPEAVIEKPRQGLIIACVPAYNEDLTLGSVIIKATKYVHKVVVCDDGSNDMTGEITSLLGADLISNKNNQGKGAALKLLFEYAKQLNADIVVTLDSDGQHDPNEIPRLISPIVKGDADLVIGSRYANGAISDAPSYRRVGLKLINSLTKEVGHGKIKDTQSGFRAYSRAALELMLLCTNTGYGIESEQISIATEYGLRIKEVPIKVRYGGLIKTSNKDPLSHGMEILESALKIIVERKPLLLLGLPGAAMVAIGAIASTYLLWYFNAERYFSLPFALIALGGFIVGFFFIMTALILYGFRLMRSNQPVNKNVGSSG